MRPLTSFAALLVSLATAPATVEAQTDLEARVRELERRVAALEQALAHRPVTGRDSVLPVPDSGGMLPMAATLLRKGFTEGRFEDRITLAFEFRNNLEKAVRAFTGIIVFQDLFERDILRVNLTVEQAVDVGAVVTWEGGIDYNQFMDSHQRLRTVNQQDLITKFELASVIFQDGSRRSFSG